MTPDQAMPNTCSIFRADYIRGLLRPKSFRTAYNRLASGRIAAEQFKTAQDKAIVNSIPIQEAAGLGVVTGDKRYG